MAYIPIHAIEGGPRNLRCEAAEVADMTSGGHDGLSVSVGPLMASISSGGEGTTNKVLLQSPPSLPPSLESLPPSAAAAAVASELSFPPIGRRPGEACCSISPQVGGEGFIHGHRPSFRVHSVFFIRDSLKMSLECLLNFSRICLGLSLKVSLSKTK